MTWMFLFQLIFFMLLVIGIVYLHYQVRKMQHMLAEAAAVPAALKAMWAEMREGEIAELRQTADGLATQTAIIAKTLQMEMLESAKELATQTAIIAKTLQLETLDGAMKLAENMKQETIERAIATANVLDEKISLLLTRFDEVRQQQQAVKRVTDDTNRVVTHELTPATGTGETVRSQVDAIQTATVHRTDEQK